MSTYYLPSKPIPFKSIKGIKTQSIVSVMPDLNKKSDLNYERYDICYINGENPMTMHSLKTSTGDTMFSLDARFELFPEKLKMITQIEKYFKVILFKEHTKDFEYIRKKKYRNDILKHIIKETMEIFYEMITPYNNRGVLFVDSNEETHLYMNGRKASDDEIQKLNLQKMSVNTPNGNKVVISDKDHKSLLLSANKEILKMQAPTVIQSPEELTEYIDNDISKIIWDFFYKDDDDSNNIKHFCVLYPSKETITENEMIFFEIFPSNLTPEKMPVNTPLHYLFRLIPEIQKPIKIELVSFHNFDYNGPMGGFFIGMDNKGNCMFSSYIPPLNKADDVKRISSWNEIKSKRNNVEDKISLMLVGENNDESYFVTPEGRKDLLAKGGIKEFYRSDKQDCSPEVKNKLIS